jgi:alkylhydroperoxidase family enzyme
MEGDMARVSLEHRRSIPLRAMTWYSRRRTGKVAEPMLLMYHNKRVLRSTMRFEMSVQRWHAVDPTLRALATMAAAAEIGCSWCVDFGYWINVTEERVPAAKLRAVPRWSTSPDLTDLERAVCEYATAMSRTPVQVTDEMVDRLCEDLTDEQIVEITALVALENQRSRTNAAMGLTAQGFREQCSLADR